MAKSFYRRYLYIIASTLLYFFYGAYTLLPQIRMRVIYSDKIYCRTMPLCDKRSAMQHSGVLKKRVQFFFPS